MPRGQGLEFGEQATLTLVRERSEAQRATSESSGRPARCPLGGSSIFASVSSSLASNPTAAMNLRSCPKRRHSELTGPKRDATTLLAVLLLSAGPALAGATSVSVSSGQYGLRAGQGHEVGIEVEVRPPWQWGPLRPVVGALAGSSGGGYLFTGLVLELPLPGGIQLSPGLGTGIVLSQGQRDLGSPIEFRSSIELSRLLVPPVRLAISFSHLSNGGLSHHNPGVETMMLGFEFAPSR
jgi:hypothetical protein